MEDEKFGLLMNVIKVLEKNGSKEVIDSAIDLIDYFDEDFSSDQRSEILKEFFHFQKHKSQKLDYDKESYKDGFERFIKTNDFF